MEYDLGTLKTRINELCKEKGMKPTVAFEKSGVGKNFLSNLKNSKPSMQKLTALANYLGTSIDYLLGTESKEQVARKVMDDIVEWLEDNDYTYEEQDDSTIAIGKNGKYTYLTFGDFMQESLSIDKKAKNGFELAMQEWVRQRFPSTNNGNYLNNSMNGNSHSILYMNNSKAKKGEFTKQEIEIITTYRQLPILKQVELIQQLLKLKEETK